MNVRTCSNSPDWRDLYAAALFEDDKSKIAVRVADAEMAMLSRAKLLFSSADLNRKEAVELDQSLRMLRLLKTCLLTEIESRPAAQIQPQARVESQISENKLQS